MKHMVYICGMRWWSFLARSVPLVLPGLLLLAGGRSAPQPVRGPGAALPPTGLMDLVIEALYPDSTLTLLACSVLICAPGLVLVLGADYIGEIVFWRVPLAKTPGVIWRVLGYGIALSLAGFAMLRALPV
ncbi:MAG: hypothetical protein GY842_02460 [bacterium]|nr:hypothetical protein [bacterium]